ncbi:MAG: hypothetical protein ACI9VI_000622 [Candidatus Azotimanducaceae bacterium]
MAKAMIDSDEDLWHSSGEAFGSIVTTEDFKEAQLVLLNART